MLMVLRKTKARGGFLRAGYRVERRSGDKPDCA